MRKAALFVFFSILSALTASAATVLVSIVQNEEAPSSAYLMSSTIEDQLMGSYYDWGQIITNDEIRYDGSRFPESDFGLQNATEVYADFLLVVFLQYERAEIVNSDLKLTYSQLVAVQWRLVRIRDKKVIGGSTIASTALPLLDPDPYKNARSLADIIAFQSRDAMILGNTKEN